MRSVMVYATLAIFSAAILAEGGLPPVARPLNVSQPIAVDLLDRYERGEGERIAASLAAAPIDDVARLSKGLEADAPRWIAASAQTERPRRRLVAATLALEAVAASFPSVRGENNMANPWAGWRTVGPLIEWGCGLVRQNPPGPAERLWQLGALAVAGGARDQRLSETMERRTTRGPAFNHVQHAIEQFPDEPRFPLAEAVALESLQPMEVLSERFVNDPVWRALVPRREAVIRAFEPLTATPAIRAEAYLHVAFLRFHLHDYPAALAGFKEAADPGADPYVRYLGFYFAGRMLDRLGQPGDAEASYMLALEAIPNVYSGVEALATKLFLSGQPDQAYALVAKALAAKPRADDPATFFPLGDYRRWPELIRQLRAALR